MEELYSETFLKAKPPVKWKVIRVLLIILAAFFVAIGLFFSLLMGTMLVFFVMVILAGIVFYFVPTNKIAYEYIFVDGQIDFDRILNGSKRKTMQRIDMEKMEFCTPENSHRLEQYKQMPLKDYSSGMSGDSHWIAVVLGEKGVERIKFTPDEKMLHMMKMKYPSKIVEI
ncbi:MAG: DUF6106 family protein [Butyribacter sp.]|nr:DUF6106 family protein [bacterium]MDY3855227.1 DUF6106 family protein [Butyribacter sp.]